MKGVLRYEWKNGYYENRIKLFIGIGVLIFISYVVIEDSILTYSNAISAGDCWLYLFSGSAEYKYSADTKFEVPVLWFLFHSYLFFMLCSYPINDLKKMGVQSMIFSKSRRKWCMSKLLWTASGVVMFYVMELGILIFEILLYNKLYGQEIMINLRSDLMGNEWIIMYLLPLIADIAIAVFQMMISFYWNYFVAYIYSLVFLIVSAYIKNLFMLGNYSMLLRNIKFDETGLSTEKGIIISICYILLSVFLCVIHIQNRNIMGKESEV